MINSQDVKNGVCIRMDGRLYFVIEFLHVKPGKGNTIMRVKFKDVVDGRVLERRFNIGEKLEDVRVERRPYQYLYKEGEDYIFMNQETYEQVPIAHDLITGVDFLKEGFVVDVVSDASTDTILFAEPRRIVYVSCNPATQARDLALLDAQYKVTAVQPVDMFPHTHHVENVVRLDRREQ